MADTSKYLIHTDITADGVVERSDVVGAIFGQTEGLLGDELDLRDLQESSKVGRIDVEIDSQNGQSFGEVTIASGLDRVETAILAAALETIDRIGPCRAKLSVANIEDVRTAKRREIVDRATALLTDSFEGRMSSQDIVSEVRQSVRVEDVTEYEGYPAGPRVANSDAIIIVEGRADVLALLQYGIKNAVAVEGTDVPDEIVSLTEERTVTAFLDGDRGGELILKELDQVGDVDYVALAPADRSVEDLDRHEVMKALREKVPYDMVAEAGGRMAATDGSARPAPDVGGDTGGSTGNPVGESPGPAAGPGGSQDAGPGATGVGADGSSGKGDGTAGPTGAEGHPATLRGNVQAVIQEETGRARLLDDEFRTLAEGAADEAFGLVEGADQVPAVLVLDGSLSQRVLDVCAQRGVGQVIAADTGEFVKKPADVRLRTAERLLSDQH